MNSALILGLLLSAISIIRPATSNAQVTRYQGSYYLYSSYYSHNSNLTPVAWTWGTGFATLRSNGAASYTCTYPFTGWAYIWGQSYFTSRLTGSGTGSVTSTGLFRFNNGVVGNCQLWGNLRNGRLANDAVGMGSFYDRLGAGVFGAMKYR